MMAANHLAMALLATTLSVTTTGRVSAQTDQPTTLVLGTARTAAEAAAVRLAVSYAEQFVPVFKPGMVLPNSDSGTSYLLDFAPTVSIETGDNDAFNAVIAKFSGNAVWFHYKRLASIPVVDLDRVVHVVPVSAGFETDRRFDNVNALLEVGYTPLIPRKAIFEGLRFGVFLQGGYKFRVDTTASGSARGGARDQSGERPESGLFRAQANIRLEVPLITYQEVRGFRLLLDASGWLDMAHTEWYHSLDATFKMPLTSDKSFDFTYQNGSGAPNFNKGEQFSANLSFAF